ncbi:MAG TPA: hypothetical protein VMI11_15330 [Actinomycetes bacterium]|nr:hypothetical protein [Actinomycetes bacterium]
MPGGVAGRVHDSEPAGNVEQLLVVQLLADRGGAEVPAVAEDPPQQRRAVEVGGVAPADVPGVLDVDEHARAGPPDVGMRQTPGVKGIAAGSAMRPTLATARRPPQPFPGSRARPTGRHGGSA